MIIFPAIDLFEQKAVRLFKGDYRRMTVYAEHPEEVVRDFVRLGASHAHLVDLEGAKSGQTPNFETFLKIREAADEALAAILPDAPAPKHEEDPGIVLTDPDAPKRFFLEIGGGIRSMETAEKYLSAGADRVILGTAAVTDEGFLKEAVAEFGTKTAVGADLKGGYVSVRGWTENAGLTAFQFFERLVRAGVSTVICTDISKDGAMQGTNVSLYRELTARFPLNLIASGGVSSLEDVRRLKAEGLYGAIIGKAYYTGAIDLSEAIREAT